MRERKGEVISLGRGGASGYSFLLGAWREGAERGGGQSQGGGGRPRGMGGACGGGREGEGASTGTSQQPSGTVRRCLIEMLPYADQWQQSH